MGRLRVSISGPAPGVIALVLALAAFVAAMWAMTYFVAFRGLGLGWQARAVCTSVLNMIGWWWLLRPPRWVLRRRARRAARARFEAMAWPHGWRVRRLFYALCALWAGQHVLAFEMDLDTLINVGCVFWALRLYRRTTGLRLSTARALRAARKTPWQGYVHGPRLCTQCRGTGMLRSRISPDISYPCNVCRWRGTIPA